MFHADFIARDETGKKLLHMKEPGHIESWLLTSGYFITHPDSVLTLTEETCHDLALTITRDTDMESVIAACCEVANDFEFGLWTHECFED